MTLNIVMGVSSSGRTHFIKEKFPEWKYLSIGDYQDRLKQEKSENAFWEMTEYINMLAKANEQIKEDIVSALMAGDDIVLEHTLYKAKRRIAYMEEFKRIPGLHVNIYVIEPSDDRLRRNLELKGDLSEFERLRKEMEEIEYPNIVEGYDRMFIVKDSGIKEYFTEPDTAVIERAKMELEQEAQKVEEKKKKIQEKEQFFKELNEKGFWHYCECCGAKKFMTPKEAFADGWDYPPGMGYFGVIGPRKCGNCGIENTVWWKLQRNMEKENIYDGLDEKDKKTIRRILAEPHNLLKEEIL